ncbi:MAG: hypothetical protein V3V20_09095, partial [Algisphaera sp.]
MRFISRFVTALMLLLATHAHAGEVSILVLPDNTVQVKSGLELEDISTGQSSGESSDTSRMTVNYPDDGPVALE